MPVWMYIAKHINCTIAEAMQRVSSSEFNLWRADFIQSREDKWVKGSDPLHYYFAALLQQGVAVSGTKPRKLDEYLIDFKAGSQQTSQDHKNLIFGMLGIKDGN